MLFREVLDCSSSVSFTRVALVARALVLALALVRHFSYFINLLKFAYLRTPSGAIPKSHQTSPRVTGGPTSWGADTTERQMRRGTAPDVTNVAHLRTSAPEQQRRAAAALVAAAAVT